MCDGGGDPPIVYGLKPRRSVAASNFFVGTGVRRRLDEVTVCLSKCERGLRVIYYSTQAIGYQAAQHVEAHCQ